MRNRKGILTAITVLAIAVLAGIGLLAYSNSTRNNKKSQAAFNYQKYTVYTLIDGKMSFEVPSDLQKLTENKDQVEFIQYWSVNNNPGETYVAGLVQPASKPLSDLELKDISQSIEVKANSKNNPAYNTVKKFITDRAGRGGWKIEVEPAKSFTNPAIYKNAWSFDFTSKYADNEMLGRAVYAISNNNYYYFMVSSSSHNWQNQAGTWDRLLNSVKLED